MCIQHGGSATHKNSDVERVLVHLNPCGCHEICRVVVDHPDVVAPDGIVPGQPEAGDVSLRILSKTRLSVSFLVAQHVFTLRTTIAHFVYKPA